MFHAQTRTYKGAQEPDATLIYVTTQTQIKMETKSLEYFQELETFESPYEPLMSTMQTRNNSNDDIEWKAATARDLSARNTISEFAVDELRTEDTVPPVLFSF